MAERSGGDAATIKRPTNPPAAPMPPEGSVEGGQDFGAGAGAGAGAGGTTGGDAPGATEGGDAPGETAGGVAPGAGATGAAGFPKSTFGGVLTALSSATAKFGFTLILKIIAVKFVGNWRTVVLYSCTVLM